MSAPSDESTPHLAVINGLRGWAILGVVSSHAIVWYLAAGGLSEERALAFRARHPILPNGFFGVNLFFVLSGFVLSLPYVRGRRTMNGRSDVLDFARRRAARLLPLYYFAVLLGTLLGTESDYLSAAFLREMALLASFGFVFSEPYFFPRCNMTLWSLGIEFWFSVAFPALLLFSRRVGVVPLLATALATSLAVRIYGASLHPDATAALNNVKDGVFGRLDDFVVGIGLCFLAARTKPVGRVASLALVALGVGLFLTACFGWNAVVRRELPYGATAYLSNVIQASAASLVIGLLGDAPRVVRLAFTAWPIQLLGMMCYSLYVWHTMGRLGPFWDEGDLPVLLALLLLLSAMSYRYIEFPRRTLRELFARFPA